MYIRDILGTTFIYRVYIIYIYGPLWKPPYCIMAWDRRSFLGSFDLQAACWIVSGSAWSILKSVDTQSTVHNWNCLFSGFGQTADRYFSCLGTLIFLSLNSGCHGVIARDGAWIRVHGSVWFHPMVWPCSADTWQNGKAATGSLHRYCVTSLKYGGPSCSCTGCFGNLDLGNKKLAKLVHGYIHAKSGFDSVKVTRMFTLFSSWWVASSLTIAGSRFFTPVQQR